MSESEGAGAACPEVVYFLFFITGELLSYDETWRAYILERAQISTDTYTIMLMTFPWEGRWYKVFTPTQGIRASTHAYFLSCVSMRCLPVRLPVCLWRRALRGGCCEFKATPIALCLNFGILCLFCVCFVCKPPPPSSPFALAWLGPFLPSSVGWWVCLFVWIRSDTASSAYRHTDAEITSEWQRERDGKREGGREAVGGEGRVDRQMYRQSPGWTSVRGEGGWVSLTSITSRRAGLLWQFGLECRDRLSSCKSDGAWVRQMDGGRDGVKNVQH